MVLTGRCGVDGVAFTGQAGAKLGGIDGFETNNIADLNHRTVSHQLPSSFSPSLTAAVINRVPYLIVGEDIGNGKRNLVNENAQAKGEKYNDMFFLELTTKNPTRDNLVRFSVGPRGCELTGPIFTPDGKTMFVVVQNPNKGNIEPFNRSIVVAVTGVF